MSVDLQARVADLEKTAEMLFEMVESGFYEREFSIGPIQFRLLATDAASAVTIELFQIDPEVEGSIAIHEDECRPMYLNETVQAVIAWAEDKASKSDIEGEGK